MKDLQHNDGYTPWRIDESMRESFPHILAFQFNTISGGKPLHSHRHANVIEIVFIERGSFDFIVDTKKSTVVSGEAMVSCPWEEHGVAQTILMPGQLAWIQIAVEEWERNRPLRLGSWCGLSRQEQQVLGKLLAADHTPFLGKCDDIRDVLLRLRCELSDARMFQNFTVNFLLTGLLVRVARNLRSEPGNVDWIAKKIELLQQQIRQSPGGKWSIEEMSRAINVSRSCLERCVKTVTGLTPHALLVRERLNRSLDLLRKSSHDITTIAFELGFSSSSHFSSWFNRTFSLSPDQYRKVIAAVPEIGLAQLVRARELMDKLKVDPHRPAEEFVVYKAAGLSPTSMDCVFKALTGHTLHDYQRILQSEKT